ncbi:MAG: SDR family oxidoreductase, partial [Tunicatimonas sp.]|uniref:SDR family oxidoreductase n=1 Tax=Tunicatimonas sp. TaxID=1940096 RepID=UPI003C761FFD
MRKKVIIIGGSSGIGQATAERFAREGWQVMVGAPEKVATQQVVDSLPGDGHIAVEVDITSDNQIEDLKKQTQNKFADFHTLINCAGISRSVPLLDPDFKKWDHLLQV